MRGNHGLLHLYFIKFNISNISFWVFFKAIGFLEILYNFAFASLYNSLLDLAFTWLP